MAMSAATVKDKITGKKRLATAMAFLTAWANITIFTQFRCFATMMTGNTLWMAVAFSEARYWDVLFYGSVILSYVTGSAIFRRTDLSLRKQTLPVCAAIVALLFGLADLAIYYVASPGASTSKILLLWKKLPVLLLATGFGIINAVGQEVCGTLTFVVTGHMARLTNQFVERVSRTTGRQKLTTAQRMAAIQNTAVCTGFFGGALWAAVSLAKGWLHRFGTLTVIGVSYATLWLLHDIESLGGAWWLRKDGVMCDEVNDDGGICDIIEEEEEEVAAKDVM